MASLVRTLSRFPIARRPKRGKKTAAITAATDAIVDDADPMAPSATAEPAASDSTLLQRITGVERTLSVRQSDLVALSSGFCFHTYDDTVIISPTPEMTLPVCSSGGFQ